jgi:hypothetical protein
MNARVARLRCQSFEAEPRISVERALLVTEFYRENYGKFSSPVLRALNFKNLCEKKTIYIGEDELIVGERGPFHLSGIDLPFRRGPEDFRLPDDDPLCDFRERRRNL